MTRARHPIESVAVIGLGRMGSIFASRLVEAGMTTGLFDVDAAAIASLRNLGASPHASAAAAARDADVTILSLPTPDVVDRVVNDILDSGPARPTIVDMSTIDPRRAVGFMSW